MAHRELRKSRVLVVAAGFFLFLLVLWIRVGTLQTVLHEHFAERAKANQQHRERILPKRGVITDRRGRVVASDLGVSQVAVNPRQLEDPVAAARLLAPYSDKTPVQLLRQLKGLKRYTWINRELSPKDGQALRAARLPGVVVEDETRRTYAFGEAAAEVIGRTNLDNVGADGIEYQFDDLLAGRQGWVTTVPTGTGGHMLRLPGAASRPAEDGASMQLTIDGEMQAIVEQHLARAVDSLNALRGFAIFVDPWSGEILAAACVPHLPPGQAKNWNFTDQYEPGSTFKVVAAGAALEERVAGPETKYDATTTGAAELVPGAVIHDTHPHGIVTLHEAMQVSSNIVMGRVALQLGDERLYRYTTALGFGSMTGLEFPGETAGRLRAIEKWQPRSAPTIAIGHEITVSPLQLALAYGAIANGGVLMKPMLVRSVRTADGREVRSSKAQPSHRVFSESTTRILMSMLAAVVDSGTATTARLRDIRIAGKTGTAQKWDASARSYNNGKYLASFAGIAPADRPRVVGVVVIDEPRGGQYYGGQIAAPIFREVMLDLQRIGWSGFDKVDGAIAMRPPQVPTVTVPDLRLLPRKSAQQRVADYHLNIRFEGQGARVLSQVPPAGQPVDHGTLVLAYLSAPADSLGRALPNLVGLPVREAMRRLSQREVPVRISGNGIVTRQEPAAGSALPLSGPCRLWCSPGESGTATRESEASTPLAARVRRP